MPKTNELAVLEFPPETKTFQQDVLQGLGSNPRTIPSKYFYDEIGSRLFDKICELDEYYLTRTELSIMHQFAFEMAEEVGPKVMLVEYGSGSSIKTRILLNALVDPVAYVPVDISLDHLRQSAEDLAREFPKIEVLPVYADFTQSFNLPNASRSPARTAVYFPVRRSEIFIRRPPSTCCVKVPNCVALEVEYSLALIFGKHRPSSKLPTTIQRGSPPNSI